jgi:voltage-gated potassium channel
MAPKESQPSSDASRWRHALHEVIFESDTAAGKTFDVALLAAITLSVLAVALESVASIRASWGTHLQIVEWTLTVLFTIEYVLRLLAVRAPVRYATSFFGVVDLAALLPTYLSLLFGGAQALMAVRALRLLRIFRIFKLSRYVAEMAAMRRALVATRAKIFVFLFVVLTAVLVMGTLVYVIEGERSGFTSIPRAVYWAIVTMTTVGYGDIAPQTPLGQLIAALAMILGYSLIIIPTGVFAVELVQAGKVVSGASCPRCSREGHDFDATHCKYCGEAL